MQKQLLATDIKEVNLLAQPDLDWLQGLIRDNNTHDFYIRPAWRALRKEVLAEQRHECQECKARGFYKRANHVHHVNHVRKHPELALSKWYMDDNGLLRRNLIAVCKECHETVCHPERLRWNKKEQLTEERWD